jgi:hypothetical protein
MEYVETGILFYVYTPPAELKELAYRMVIDGLWSTDPGNPLERRVPGGFSQSLVYLPPRPPARGPSAADPGVLSLRYSAGPGERITVGGDFNGWDPFMYELRETSPGYYTLNLPLPPGTYRYVFFHRGERVIDPGNPRMVYTREGKTASEALIR